MNKLTKKINILQLVSSLQVGGLEKLLVEFIKSSEINSQDVTQDVNFTVVIMNDGTNEALKKELLATKYNIYFLNRKEGHKHPKYLFQLLDIIKKNNIDIIHTHNSGGKFWSILCKFFTPKIKLVYTVHNSISLKNLSKIKLFLHKRFIDMNIAISNVICEDYLNSGFLKTTKIYNGVDTKKFIVNEKKLQDSTKLNITNIARITYQIKGQDILIKALKECKNKGMNFVCNFVGGVYEYDIESLEYLKNLINELELTNEIHFLGNRNNVPELLSQSDLFVLPSRHEGFPISLLEAMAAKVPIIASNISGSNDLIKTEENGLLFKSEDHYALADKILYLYHNKNKMIDLAENAYTFVQGFDISVMCQRYCELYKNIKKSCED